LGVSPRELPIDDGSIDPPDKDEDNEIRIPALDDPPDKKGPEGPDKDKPEEEVPKELDIGKMRDGKPVKLPLDIMKKHFVCFGASGSGKTVLGKVLLEELVRNGVPTIIVDPQGDLASLGLLGEQTDLLLHEADLDRAKEFANKAEVRIFTPTSSKGIPLRVDVFRMPDKDLPKEERVNAIDMTASSIIQLLDYDYHSPKGKAARKYLYMLLTTADEAGRSIEDMSELVELVRSPDEIGLKPGRVIKKKDRETLSIDLGHLTIGVDELIFTNGVPMTMETFMRPVQEGRTPINVVYLNTLNTDRHKHFFVASLCKELYSWMLKNPSDDIQLAFYIDEVGPFMPPHPRNPPAKQLLKMLFKQGRKYGVSMMMCTQNIADIEYKALAQASTWALGRLMTHQDLGKVQHLLKSLPQEEYEKLMETIPKLKVSNFALLSADVFKETTLLKCRWLYTQHHTLEEDALKGAMRPEVLDYYQDPLKMAPGEDVVFQPIETQDETGPAADEPKAVDPAEPVDPWPHAPQDTLTPGERLETPGANSEAKVERSLAPPTPQEAPEEPYNPEDRFIYIADVKVPQSEAAKKLLDWKKNLFRLTEEVKKVETEYLLLWRLRIQVEVEEGGMLPFLRKKVSREENMYIEGSRNLSTSGQLMQVEDTVKFSNVTKKQAHEILDLDGQTEFSVIETKDLPFNVDKVPQLSKAEVERILYNLFGLRIIKARRVIYRVWRFTVRDKRTGKERFVRIDSVFGKPVSIL
jgi:hypothetical protein